MAPKDEIDALTEVVKARLRAEPKDHEDWKKIDDVIKEMGKISSRTVRMHKAAEGGGRS